MGKRLMVFLTVFMMSITFGGVVQAHSVMVSSDPEEGSTAEGEVSTVTMTFDTEIKQEEEIYLENTEGERIDYEDVTVEGEMVEVSFSEPLASGDYTVVWELYGADGHLVNGDFGFSVAGGDEAGDSEESTEEQTAEESEEASEEETDESEEVATEDAAVDESGGMSGGVIAVIVGLVIIGIAMIIFFSRRRK